MDMREKLVEILDEVQDFGQAVTCSSETVTISRTDNYGVADHLIANNVTVQEWIPVSEPPKEDGDYLVYLDYGYVKLADVRSFALDGETIHKYELAGKENVWYRYDSEYGYVSCSYVTHWMPMHQPPKGA